MNVYELLRTIKANKHCNSIPVLAASATALSGDAEEGLIEGFQEYVTKRFDIKHLQPLIREHAIQGLHSLPKRCDKILLSDNTAFCF